MIGSKALIKEALKVGDILFHKDHSEPWESKFEIVMLNENNVTIKKISNNTQSTWCLTFIESRFLRVLPKVSRSFVLMVTILMLSFVSAFSQSFKYPKNMRTIQKQSAKHHGVNLLTVKLKKQALYRRKRKQVAI